MGSDRDKARLLLAIGIPLVLGYILFYVSLSEGWRAAGTDDAILIEIILFIIFLIIPGIFFLIKSYITIEIHLKTKKKKITRKQFCPKCGSEIDARTMFCFKCRKKSVINREDIRTLYK